VITSIKAKLAVHVHAFMERVIEMHNDRPSDKCRRGEMREVELREIERFVGVRGST